MFVIGEVALKPKLIFSVNSTIRIFSEYVLFLLAGFCMRFLRGYTYGSANLLKGDVKRLNANMKKIHRELH